MALDLLEADAMIEAAHRSRVRLIVGPSHSFDAPILLARQIIASGRYGRLRMLTLLTYTDFLYRPRRPEELDTARGGGAVFNQAAHQVDIARLLAGGMLTSLNAQCAAWDPARPTEGAYSALLRFQDGAFAALTYSGYGHFDTDALAGWVSEDGRRKDAEAHGAARRRLAAAGSAGEAALRAARFYGAAPLTEPPPDAHPHFGLLIASCEGADLLPSPTGVAIHADTVRDFVAPRPPHPPRQEVLDALFAAVTEGRAPVQTGEWGRATLEACLAILHSAQEGRDIPLSRQVPA
jgi:phthalate 4,5-cis-dihydrodiol dehydrogenase